MHHRHTTLDQRTVLPRPGRSRVTSLAAYVATPAGSAYFKLLQRNNAAAFPEMVEEMRGISAGAGVPMAAVWLCNVIRA